MAYTYIKRLTTDQIFNFGIIISNNPLCFTRCGYNGRFSMRIGKINDGNLTYAILNDKNELISAFRLTDYLLQVLINDDTKGIKVDYNEIYKLWKNYLVVIFKENYQQDLENNSLKY